MGRDYVIDLNLEELLGGKQNFAEIMERIIFTGWKKGTERLKQEAQAKLKENLYNFGLANTKLSEGIYTTDLDDGFLLGVRASRDGNDYTMYVEYGTGVVGEGFQHPDPSMADWEYDINQHGDEGWWYPSYEEDRNSTKYQTKDGVWWAWTAGQASRPFMYHTWLWLMDNADNIMVEEMFKEMEKFKW